MALSSTFVSELTKGLDDRRDRKNAAKMSILRKQIQKEQAPCFLTQYN
jgi:hypothetical protein